MNRTVVYAYNGILLSNKKEHTNMCYKIDRPSDKWMNRTVVYAYNGILLSNKKEHTNMCYKIDRP